MMTAPPARVQSRNRILLALILPLFIFAALTVGRAGFTVRPYELGWCVWVLAILASGIGIGYGLARYRR